MKKYIAGFRSNNPKNTKKAIIYYILVTIFFMIGSSWSLNDISLLLIMLLTPSIIMNFKQMISKNNDNDKYEKKIVSKKESVKIFLLTLIPYVLVLCLFDYTYVDAIEDSAVENKTSIESTIKEEVTDIKNENTEESIETENIIETKDSEIHFINTGNSDAILIKQGDLSALIDGGDNDDESRVVSYLKNQGISELEYVFATHPDADHIGGLDAVVNSISIKNMYVSNGKATTKTYSDFINAMANKRLNPSVPLLNSEFKLGTSTFKVLSVANESDVNNNSIVLLYTNGEDKVLLMGDADSSIEAKINVEDIDLIKVGHHGSKTSTSSSFINKINPEYAVITVGVNNKYGHPHKETMSILEASNIQVHRSDECGNIIFKSSGKGLSVDCKAASYNAGNSSDGSISNSATNSTTSNNSITLNNSTTVVEEIQQTQPEISSDSSIVYWTPNGKSYHTTRSCSTLSRSKTILSGTQVESGKSDPCDRCH